MNVGTILLIVASSLTVIAIAANTVAFWPKPLVAPLSDEKYTCIDGLCVKNNANGVLSKEQCYVSCGHATNPAWGVGPWSVNSTG